MKISRNKVIKEIAKIRSKLLSKKEVEDLLYEYNIQNVGDLELNLTNALKFYYEGITNGYLSEAYEIITGNKVEVIGDVIELFKCPCCQYRTLTELYDVDVGTGYDICGFCGWEDDGTTEKDAQSSVNKGTINDYLQNIKNKPNLYYRQKWKKI